MPLESMPLVYAAGQSFLIEPEARRSPFLREASAQRSGRPHRRDRILMSRGRTIPFGVGPMAPRISAWRSPPENMQQSWNEVALKGNDRTSAVRFQSSKHV